MWRWLDGAPALMTEKSFTRSYPNFLYLSGYPAFAAS
jgi:hypothetical protein